MEIIHSTAKKKIINQLSESFGVEKFNFLPLQFGKEKMRIYSGSLSKEELILLDNHLRIESAGLYFGKYDDDKLRLSIDTIHILKDKISKNIIELNDKEAEDWMKGLDLEIKSDKNTFKVIKHNDDLLGCGKSSGDKILNFLPKERRIR